MYLSSLLASDDEEDSKVVDITSQEEGNSVPLAVGATKATKRPRSRSRSLTPPPKLSMQQILNVRHVVRTTLEEKSRADSPTNDYIDDSVDTIVLDEDLVSIARQVQAQVDHGGDSKDEGGPEIVTIEVHWLPHPLDTNGRAAVWTFEMKRHDTFHALFEEVGDTAGILTRTLVLTHGGSRVFASATPHSLKVWAVVQMDASDMATFEYLREQRHEGPPPTTDAAERSPSPFVSADGAESESDVQSTAEDDDDVFKLIVRSGVTKDVTLKVRPTTSCGAIVKAFLKRTGIADKYLEGKSSRRRSAANGPRLMIDGVCMDPDTPISEADLEDGDQVEVAGL
ncbi:hypothetical protein B0F90DRAFT_1889935 [Multifurca ochricompacta]|uniref:Rad60/SUMO-like domain-containing protein n=1 Tax=Multifurca ochricompacta TaxID=376703 RepID=A0AAD4QMP8_9AGAM|nr:hypothetical protein B0F90DRAFT_1889935 [Multifurca ochricompacta]